MKQVLQEKINFVLNKNSEQKFDFSVESYELQANCLIAKGICKVGRAYKDSEFTLDTESFQDMEQVLTESWDHIEWNIDL